MENQDTTSTTLNYPESAQQANEYLRLVLPMLAKFNLAPNPINFTLCYEYVSNGNQELSTILDQVLNQEKGLSKEAAIDLYRRYIWDEARRSAEKQSNELYRVMTDTISGIDQSNQQVSHSSQQISKCSSELSKQRDLNEIRSVITDVVAETRTIAQNSRDLHVMLTETKQEVENLRVELKRSREQATTDPLTSLLNRRAFDQQLASLSDEVLVSREPLGLMIIDIDNFKRVNDTYGHIIGDKVIHFVAKQLTSNTKGKDVVARIGGEEYAILLPSTQLENARILAEHIRIGIERSRLKRLDTSQVIDGITVSIGVTVYKHGEISEDFISRADQALYKSKNAGRNRVSIAF